jgi:hypothetical protein
VRTPRPLVALVASLLVACGAAEDDPSVDTPEETATEEAPQEETTPDDAGPTPVPDGEEVADLDAAVEAAVADLAASAGVDPSQVEVRIAERVTWSDGALGCPEPGMMYTQALVPGYRVVLTVDGTDVAYHGAEGAAPARCDDPQPPSDPGS